jgi:hypothetical protein
LTWSRLQNWPAAIALALCPRQTTPSGRLESRGSQARGGGFPRPLAPEPLNAAIDHLPLSEVAKPLTRRIRVVHRSHGSVSCKACWLTVGFQMWVPELGPSNIVQGRAGSFVPPALPTPDVPQPARLPCRSPSAFHGHGAATHGGAPTYGLIRLRRCRPSCCPLLRH